MGFLKNRGLTEDERARVPPGQHVVRDFPVLHEGGIPYGGALPADWDLRVWGAVEHEARWDFGEFRALPAEEVTCDIHCVTTWSKLDTRWLGVPMSWVIETVKPLPGSTHVVAHAEGGYTANMPLEALLQPGVMLAYRFDGKELEPQHGWPLRLLVPQLYLWKSAKWLRGLEFRIGDAPGYWEVRGYSNSADPWREERYGF